MNWSLKFWRNPEPIVEDTVRALARDARPRVELRPLEANTHMFATKVAWLEKSLDAEQVSTLIAANSSSHTSFEGKTVLAFQASDLAAFVDRHNLVMVERYGSNAPNVEWVRFAQKPRLPRSVHEQLRNKSRMLEHQFEMGRWSSSDESPESWRRVAYTAARILAPTLRRKIILDVPHGHVHEYAERGAFQIYVWSTPDATGSRDTRPPRTIWGYNVDCRDQGFKPSDTAPAGIPIRDGDWAVAELFPNALYIHHDMVHHGTDAELNIMALLLTEVATILADPTDFDARAALAREESVKRQQRIFRRLVEGSIPGRSERHKELIAVTRVKIERTRGELFAAERELFGLENSAIDPEEVGKRFEEEISRLKHGGLEPVERVYFKDVGGSIPRLYGRTKEITSVDPQTRRTHLLGRYEISLDFETGEIRFQNLDRRPEGCHGPHLSGEGYPCLGNIKDEMAGYLAHFEAEAAFTLAIAFLQSPNPNDVWGNHIRLFPVVKR
ncbi:MAG: hypothetical protein Q7S95_02395 [bacterium]|nr:hypothetical protein [bacterium]